MTVASSLLRRRSQTIGQAVIERNDVASIANPRYCCTNNVYSFIHGSGLFSTPNVELFNMPVTNSCSALFRIKSGDDMTYSNSSQPIDFNEANWIPLFTRSSGPIRKRNWILHSGLGKDVNESFYFGEKGRRYIDVNRLPYDSKYRDVIYNCLRIQLEKWYEIGEHRSISECLVTYGGKFRDYQPLLCDIKSLVADPLNLPMKFPGPSQDCANLQLGDYRLLHRVGFSKRGGYELNLSRHIHVGRKHIPRTNESTPSFVTALIPQNDDPGVLLGAFFFPKRLLLDETSVVAGTNSDGGISIHVYPAHYRPRSKKAAMVKDWQLPYYVDFLSESPCNYLPRIQRIFAENS